MVSKVVQKMKICCLDRLVTYAVKLKIVEWCAGIDEEYLKNVFNDVVLMGVFEVELRHPIGPCEIPEHCYVTEECIQCIKRDIETLQS